MGNIIQAYQWSGMNKQGTRLKGVLQATDVKIAEAELKSRGIDVISITLKRPSLFAFGRPKIKNKDIIFFSRYLSTMLSAGMPMLQALDVIARDQDNQTLRSVILAIRSNITSGMSLSDALSQFPDYFNDLYCNLARAGEKSATLEVVLNRIVKYLEKTEKLKQKIKSALIYPLIIAAVALVVSFILLFFVVPQFETMFKNAGVPLPAFTRGVIHVSNFLRSYWWILLLLVIAAVWIFKVLHRKNEAFARGIDALSLRLYIYGNILKKAIIARFTRTLAITLDAGLPIIDSMKMMISIMNNRIYSRALVKVCDDVTSGNQLASSLEKTHMFPNMVVQMVSVGEASGALGTMLNNIATFYEEEVDTIADNLSSLIEPIIIILLGIIIGCFVIAMYLPIFKLGTTI
jgi:type IV pilus assembly protein PilC